MRLGILFVALLALIPSALAAEVILQPNTESLLYANCLDNGVLINSTANLTAYYPNGSVFLDNIPMVNYSQGQFSHLFNTTSVIGEYQQIVTCRKSTTGAMASSGATFQVKDFEEETGMGQVAILGIFVVAIVYLLYLANRQMKQEAQGTQINWHKLLGYGLYLIASWVFLALVFVATYGFSYAESYFPVMKAIFFSSLFIIGGFNVLFIIFTIINGTTTAIGGMANGGRFQSRKGRR